MPYEKALRPPHFGRGRGDVKPTPALPKGGSLNEAQYSLTSNRLTSNGRYPPSLGEGLGVGPRLRRIAYPPEQKKALHQTVQGKR